MNEKTYPSISEAADALIEDLLNNAKNPFETPVVVCHNTKIIQWLKSYYLKKNDKVLMNVKFMTLSSFINGLLKSEKKETILSRFELRDAILTELLDSSKYQYDSSRKDSPLNYIFHEDGSYKGDCLYDFADTLSTLFVNYEFDLEDIDSWKGNADREWECNLYHSVIDKIQKDGCDTPGSLYEKIKGLDFSYKIKEPVYIFNNSYITNLYGEILAGIPCNVYSRKSCTGSEKEKNVHKTVFKAPSVVREVEEVHSLICRTVKDEGNGKYNDFVVYAPNIDDYTDTINQVFKQDDTHFPSVPYRIVGSHREQRDMASSFALLKELAGKGYFTRLDLQSFLKNPMIQRVHSISDSEAQAFMDAVVATNAYRSGKDLDDWDYLKKRLLLSQLVSGESSLENRTSIGSESFLPFSSIDMDAGSANKLIDLLDALSLWTGAFLGNIDSTMLSPDDLSKMAEILDSIYSVKSVDGDELNRYYAHVYDENEKIRESKISIPADTWLKMLSQAILSFTTHPADMFTAGVTFLSFDADNMVYEPFTFLMGASSANLPRMDIKSEIDYGKKHRTSAELDQISIDTLCFGNGNLTFSYVFRDLKKDSKFYPSSLIPKDVDYAVPLDETRKYDELFTKKEFVNKEYYDGLLTGSSALSKTAGIGANVDTTINITDIKHFFGCTFQYKFNHLCVADGEEDQTEYEPLSITTLKKYSIVKDIIKYPAANEKDISVLKRNIPEKGLGDLAFENCKNSAQKTEETINTGYSLKVLDPLTLDNGKEKWTLMCNVDMYVKEEEDHIFYLEPVEAKDVKNITPKDLISSYVFSLMDISQRESEDREYRITLREMDFNGDFIVTPQRSREVLNDIFDEMTDFSDFSYLDSDLLKLQSQKYDLFRKKIEDQDFKRKYFDPSSSNSHWKYFKDNTMVDTDKEIEVGKIEGYAEKLRKLLLFW